MSRTLELLDSLIAFPTVSADTNLPLIDWAQDLLSACGARVHRMHDETGLKAGLYAEIGPDSPGGVVLSAHSDVVPVAGQNWTRPPFRLTREDDRVFGRGTTDMKGFVACMLAAAERASRGKLAEPLKLSLSWDEEVGCIGVHKMLPDLKARIGAPRLCIVGEPTGMQAAIGHKGKAAIRADCTGENGHSAMAPHFVNALHLACDFVAGLRAMQNDLAANGARDEAYDPPCTTVHAGRMNGGRALNIVPDSATVDFEFRHIAADAADALHARLRALADTVAERYRPRFADARIDFSPIFDYPGLDTPANSEAVRFVQSVSGVDGVTKVAYGTEGGYFAGTLGIPTVVCGPGSMTEQGHKPDESIGIGELDACDTMLDRLIGAMSRS